MGKSYIFEILLLCPCPLKGARLTLVKLTVLEKSDFLKIQCDSVGMVPLPRIGLLRSPETYYEILIATKLLISLCYYSETEFPN